VFCYGFLAVGAFNLINSVLTNQYAFFIFRALNGIAAAAVVPTAYRMIGQVFPPEQRRLAYTLYTMTGSIANVSGTIIAGVFGIIQSHGQMASWRWFFRFVGVAA
jgi:MFS family permease